MNNIKLTSNEVIEEIIDEFNFFDDWEDKYAHIIDMGKKLEKLDQSLMVEDAKLKGCQSTVYFIIKKKMIIILSLKLLLMLQLSKASLLFY